AHAHHDDIGDLALALRAWFDPLGAAQLEFGHAQLTDDLTHGQVAIEALFAGRAETAIDGAARLRRDAQRAADVFWNIDGSDRIALPDVNQPLAGTAGGGVVGNNGRRRNHCARLELVAQGFGQIGHGVEVAGAELVYPALQLL